jgi:predicted ferric reductase
VNAQVWWYTARAGGIVAWVLLALSVAWGLLLSTRLLGRRPAPAWLLDLHRFLGGLAVVFTGVHIAGLVADSYVHFGVADVLVPFASAWKPGAVALGVVGFWLLLAVEITSLLMKRLPRKLWRAVHFSSFALFVVAGVHGATAGTDAMNSLYRSVTLTLVLFAVFLTLVRIFAPRRRRRPIASTARPGNPELRRAG